MSEEQTEITRLRAERRELEQKLHRFEQDLRALQSTRTVQATRLLGEVARRVRRNSPRIPQVPTAEPTLSEPAGVEKASGPSLTNYDSWFWERYSLDAVHNAEVWDFSQADLAANRRLIAASPGRLKIKSLTWFLPPFQHAYYGGIHTILRFAAYFQQNKRVDNRLVIVQPPDNYFDPASLSERISQAFPALQAAPVSYVYDYGDLAKLEPADGAVATYWTTAYFALRFQAVRRKFYMIQDFEPLFYPAGTSYALAEATYQFGFYGLTNTITLRQIYQEQYGGKAAYFVPAVDVSLFHPAERPAEPMAGNEKLKLFFYGRPGQPRNAFELGVAALKNLKARLGKRLTIVTAGAEWRPEQYGLAGLIENRGLLAYEETASLYRECQAGLVMMFTRHPSYLPFELMASGTLVVTNPNPATRWLLHDRENCLLAAPSATSLAETLELALTNTALRTTITTNALTGIRQNFTDWNGQIEKIFGYMTDPDQPSPTTDLK